MALEHHPPVPPHHEHLGRPHGEGHYTRDSDLIARIFPRGLDESKEHYARGIASRYGYSNLCDESKGEIAEVDIDRIFPCQSILNKTKVIELILYLRDNDVPGYPMGIKIDDDVYLLDGHHRVSAQILMGRKKVMIHYTALTQEMIDAQTPPRNERHSIRPAGGCCLDKDVWTSTR